MEKKYFDKVTLEHAITKDNDNQLLNGLSEDNQQIMFQTISTYIVKKSAVVDNLEKKKKDKKIKIIREYKNLFTCEELVERIIKYHSQNNNYYDDYETTETK